MTSEELPPSSVKQPSAPSSGGAAEQNAGGSAWNDTPEVIMPFQLGDGEVEEASSFVPSSIAGIRVGRPVRWSMEYLRENAEDGCGRIMATGNFGKTGPSVVFCTFSLCFRAFVVHGAGTCSFSASHIYLFFVLTVYRCVVLVMKYILLFNPGPHSRHTPSPPPSHYVSDLCD